MNSHTKYACVLYVLMALHLSGCGAIVWPASLTDTLSGMQAAVKGQPGTFAYVKDGMTILAWTAGEGQYAFVLLGRDGASLKLRDLCQGNCVSWKTAADLFRWAESQGWQNVPAGMLSPALVAAVSQAAFVARFGMPTVWLMPVVVKPPMDLVNPIIKQ